MNVGLVPIVRVALEHDAILRDTLDEAEWARAHGLHAELVAGFLRCLGRHHHAGAVGKLGQQRRERRRQVQAHGHRVDHIDAGDRREFAAPIRSGHRLVPLDVELGGGGVELLAVVEGDTRPQLDRQRLAVRRPLITGGELRDDVELVVDVEQLVAERREHDPPDEGPRQRRVEHIGIFGESETQRLRGAIGRRDHAKYRYTKREQQRFQTHVYGSATAPCGTLMGTCNDLSEFFPAARATFPPPVRRREMLLGGARGGGFAAAWSPMLASREPWPAPARSGRRPRVRCRP